MRKVIRKSTNRQGEQGSALIYILIAIALLALLTITFMEPSSQQTQSQNTFRLVSELQSQVEFIRSSTQECVMLHTGGDTNIPTGGGDDDEGADKRYPIRPDSSYLTGPAANRSVKNLRCPGNPGDNANHKAIFGGASGKFLPPAPELFGDWQWYNGTDGVFFWIETDKSDAFIQTALEKLDNEFAGCEADIIDATGGAPVTMDSDATVSCPSGSTCFRLWMIAKGSAIYPDDPSC